MPVCALALLLSACGTFEIGIEGSSTATFDLAGTVDALATENAGLVMQLTALSERSTPTATLTLPPTLIPTSLVLPSPRDEEPAAPTATPTPPPGCAVRSDWPIYTVARGDTLYRIAQMTGSTVAELAEANCLEDPDRINAGQWLRVPSVPATPQPPYAEIQIAP